MGPNARSPVMDPAFSLGLKSNEMSHSNLLYAHLLSIGIAHLNPSRNLAAGAETAPHAHVTLRHR